MGFLTYVIPDAQSRMINFKHLASNYNGKKLHGKGSFYSLCGMPFCKTRLRFQIVIVKRKAGEQPLERNLEK